jgi:CheY-like chemotaxis protein
LVAARVTYLKPSSTGFNNNSQKTNENIDLQKTNVHIDLQKLVVDIDTFALAYRLQNKKVTSCVLVPTILKCNTSMVCGPRSIWWRIITNLLINSIKHTCYPGSVSVSIEKLSKSLQIIISDQGSGMNEQMLKECTKLYTTISPSNGGTGLGIPIVNELVKKVKGNIDIQSSLEKGTIITIILPIDYKKVIFKNNTQRMILLVDDQDIVLKMFSRVVSSAGYTSVCAHSGEEALSIFKESSSCFDGVLLDQNMTGMLGTEVAAKLRLDQKYKGPIVLCTGGIHSDQLKTDHLTSVCQKGTRGNGWLTMLENNFLDID